MTAAHQNLVRKNRAIERWVISHASLLLGILISGLLVFGTDRIGFGVAGLGLLTLVGLGLSRMELLHPFTWYVPIIFLYSASVPVLVLVGVREDIGSLHETVMVEWLAMAAFMAVVGCPARRARVSYPAVPHLASPVRMVYLSALALSVAYVYGIWSSGLTTKFAINLSDSPFLRLNGSFSVLALAFAVLLADALQRRRLPWLLLAGTVTWVGFAFVYSGERALIFRILWLVLILTHAVYYRVTPRLLLVIGAFALVLVSLLSNYKERHLSEFEYSSNGLQLNTAAIAQIIFADEFVTASENLQVLIERSPWPPFRGETLSWDLQQIARLGDRRAGPSPTAFFNNFFFPEYVERGGGRGFALAGEGYMNFGPAGAALWFALLGLFVRFLYVRSRSHLLWLVIYATSMPLVAYATRADFSNILSPFLKHIIGPVFVILLLRDLLFRRSAKLPAPQDN